MRKLNLFNLVDITKSVTIPSNLSHLWARYPQCLYYKLEVSV